MRSNELNQTSYMKKGDWTPYLVERLRSAKLARDHADRVIENILSGATKMPTSQQALFSLFLTSESAKNEAVPDGQHFVLSLYEHLTDQSIFALIDDLAVLDALIGNNPNEPLVNAYKDMKVAVLNALKGISANVVSLRERFIDQMTYEEYIQSPEWGQKRYRALEQANNQCRWCGSRQYLDVHHNTYIRFKHEWDIDLTVACRKCHDVHHNELPQYKGESCA